MLLEHFTVGAQGALAFGEQGDPGRLRVQPVDKPQILQPPRLRPEVPRAQRRLQRQLQVPSRPVPRIRRQHPTRRLIQRQHRPVLVKNRYDDARLLQLDVLWFCHNPRLAMPAPACNVRTSVLLAVPPCFLTLGAGPPLRLHRGCKLRLSGADSAMRLHIGSRLRLTVLFLFVLSNYQRC